MVVDTSVQSGRCPLAEPQSKPADVVSEKQPRRRTGKVNKRKVDEAENLTADSGPSTSGRPAPQRGASSARHEIDELFAAKPLKVGMLLS